VNTAAIAEYQLGAARDAGFCFIAVGTGIAQASY